MDEIFAFLSDIEKVVYIWLTNHKIPFNMQQRFGTYREVGSATVDFILPESNIALRIMGRYWHTGLEMEGRDAMGKEILAQMGYIVVDLWEETLQPYRLDDTMEHAIKGEEVIV